MTNGEKGGRVVFFNREAIRRYMYDRYGVRLKDVKVTHLGLGRAVVATVEDTNYRLVFDKGPVNGSSGRSGYILREG